MPKDGITIKNIQELKSKGEKILMLTAYDFPMAEILDQADVDIILVGDSLANVVLGLESTTQVGMAEMIHHAKAVRRGVKRALLVGDMPYESYQMDKQRAAANAARFINEAKCDAIKIEWYDGCLETAVKIIKEGIAVMGHVGLTPQTAEQLGGFKVQGKDAQAARKIIEQAKMLEEAGCFSVVLECVPLEVSKIITDSLSIPTIGIGAGVYCDGQVLVTHDLLGLTSRHHPKFIKKFFDLRQGILSGVKTLSREVKNKQYPDKNHSYTISKEELEKL